VTLRGGSRSVLAKQKVVGSSPIIRCLSQGTDQAGLFYVSATSRDPELGRSSGDLRQSKGTGPGKRPEAPNGS